MCINKKISYLKKFIIVIKLIKNVSFYQISEVKIIIHQFTSKIKTHFSIRYNTNNEVNNDLNLQRKSTKNNQLKYYQNG